MKWPLKYDISYLANRSSMKCFGNVFLCVWKRKIFISVLFSILKIYLRQWAFYWCWNWSLEVHKIQDIPYFMSTLHITWFVGTNIVIQFTTYVLTFKITFFQWNKIYITSEYGFTTYKRINMIIDKMLRVKDIIILKIFEISNNFNNMLNLWHT